MAKDPHILTHSWEETRKQNKDPESHSTQNQKRKPEKKKKKTKGETLLVAQEEPRDNPKD